MIGIKIRMPKNCQTCPLSMNSIGDSFYEDCTCIVKEETTKYVFGSKKGRPDYCPLVKLEGDKNGNK